LLGDASKARTKLGWEPKVSFKELVTLMVDHDLELAKQESLAQKAKGLGPATKAGWGTI
jgi:GDPmannose 4,6-dehydratase